MQHCLNLRACPTSQCNGAYSPKYKTEAMQSLPKHVYLVIQSLYLQYVGSKPLSYAHIPSSKTVGLLHKHAYEGPL